MKRSITQAAAVLLTVAGLTATLPASASASTPQCRGYACDDQVASTMGCNSGSYIPRKEGAKVVTDRGVLRVFWSPGCATNWGAFDPTVAGQYFLTIHREQVGNRDDITVASAMRTVYATEIPGLRLRTKMLYAPEAQVMVCVNVPQEGRVAAGTWTRYACTEWI